MTLTPPAFDVAVVGAGPAGSLSAYRLARSGMRVVLIDSKIFPRDKACGGGVQVRTDARIPFPWDSVVRKTIRKARFSYRLVDAVSRSSASEFVRCVLRSEFDAFLVGAAERAGAELRLGERVVSVQEHDAGVKIATESGTIHGRYVIGADGANSIVTKLLNSRSDFYWQTALYLETGPPKNMSGFCPDTIAIDWGTLPCGYAWVFPKGDVVNYGVGGPNVIGRALRAYMNQFLATQGIRHNDPANKISGHQLPTLTSKTAFARGRVFLAGDAAGLVEPLTGEGISYACHSAQILGQCLQDRFEKGASAADLYTERVRRELAPDIRYARQLLSLSIQFPKLFHSLVGRSDRVWGLLCSILRGESGFADLTRSLFGPMQFLQEPVFRGLHSLEGWRLRRAAAAEPL